MWSLQGAGGGGGGVRGGGWTGDRDWSEELSKCWSWCSPKTGLGPFITCSMLKYRRQNYTWCHLLTPHTHPHPDKRTIDDKNTLCQISGACYNSQFLRVEIKSRLWPTFVFEAHYHVAITVSKPEGPLRLLVGFFFISSSTLPLLYEADPRGQWVCIFKKLEIQYKYSCAKYEAIHSIH